MLAALMNGDPARAAAWLADLDGALYKAGARKLATALELALLGAASVSALRTFRRSHEFLREEQLGDPAREFLPNAFEEQIKRAAAKSGLSEDWIRLVGSTWRG
jgi:hypothetical protein